MKTALTAYSRDELVAFLNQARAQAGSDPEAAHAERLLHEALVTLDSVR